MLAVAVQQKRQGEQGLLGGGYAAFLGCWAAEPKAFFQHLLNHNKDIQPNLFQFVCVMIPGSGTSRQKCALQRILV